MSKFLSVEQMKTHQKHMPHSLSPHNTPPVLFGFMLYIAVRVVIVEVIILSVQDFVKKMGRMGSK